MSLAGWQVVGWRLLAAAKRVHNTFWFCSELYWVRVAGSYNTTRVGSRDQRTSFQSDLHLQLHTASVISESSLSSGESRTGARRVAQPAVDCDHRAGESIAGPFGIAAQQNGINIAIRWCQGMT